MRVEIAVHGPVGAVAARDAGADRIELCSALELGGVTPSAGLIESTLAAVGPDFPVHVLIRPRPGDFCYDPHELAVILKDVRSAVAAGAAGVVVGQLHRGPSGLDIDSGALDLVVDAAGAAEVTVHRAFDLVEHPEEGLEAVIGGGARRILSSGRASDVHTGIAELGRLVGLAAGRIEVMGGGGARVGGLAEIARAGADAVHLSAKRARTLREGYALGAGTRDGVTTWFETDGALVAAAVAEVVAASR